MLVVPRVFAGVLDTWLTRNGIPLDAMPVAMPGGREPLGLNEWSERVSAAVSLCPGTARGLEIGACIAFSHLGPLGYLAVNTQNFGELIQVYQRFEKWFYGIGWTCVAFGEDEVTMTWMANSGKFDRLLEQLHMTVLTDVLFAACPAAGRPLRVEVTNDSDGDALAYRTTFECPVHFGASAVRIAYAKSALAAPIDVHGEQLQRLWTHSQRSLQETGGFARSVQAQILRHLPDGAPADVVARELGLSRRTFQRRLSDDGCRYRQLVDGVRERRARDLIEDARLTLSEMSFLLGYSEQSAFNHAYRRWTGKSPLS